MSSSSFFLRSSSSFACWDNLKANSRSVSSCDSGSSTPVATDCPHCKSCRLSAIALSMRRSKWMSEWLCHKRQRHRITVASLHLAEISGPPKELLDHFHPPVNTAGWLTVQVRHPHSRVSCHHLLRRTIMSLGRIFVANKPFSWFATIFALSLIHGSRSNHFSTPLIHTDTGWATETSRYSTALAGQDIDYLRQNIQVEEFRSQRCFHPEHRPWLFHRWLPSLHERVRQEQICCWMSRWLAGSGTSEFLYSIINDGIRRNSVDHTYRFWQGIQMEWNE